MLKKFIKDLVIYSPAKFLPALTAFITTPILTRLFPPAEYGYWAMAISVTAFLAALAVDGFGSAAIRFYPIYKNRSALDIFFATLCVSIGAIITLVAGLCFLLLLLIKKHLTVDLHPLLLLIILIFLVKSIFSVFISVIRAQGRIGTFTFLQLFVNYCSLGIGLVFVIFFGFRVQGLLLGEILALVITLPILLFLATKGTRIRPRFFQFTDALRFWHYAWPLALGNVAMWGLRVSDLFIIRLFRSESDVGIYSVSYNLSSKSIELLVALFLLSVSPLVYRTWEGEGREATEKALNMITRVYIILCFPAAVGLSVLAFPFIALLTTPNYYEAFKIVAFVTFSIFIWGLANIAMMGITVKKLSRRIAINQIIAASTHISLGLVMVPIFGYIALAISTFIGFTVLLFLQTFASRPHLTWRFPFASLRNVIVASIPMGLTAHGIYRLAGDDSNGSLIFLLLSIVVSIMIYIAFLWCLGEVKDNEKRAILQEFLRLIRKQHGTRPNNY